MRDQCPVTGVDLWRTPKSKVYPSISAYNFRVPRGPQDSKSRQNPLCGFRCVYAGTVHCRLRIYTTEDVHHIYIRIYT